MTDDQATAIEAAATSGSEFLDGLNKFDMTKLSFDEWMQFVSSICLKYGELRDRQAQEIAQMNGLEPPVVNDGEVVELSEKDRLEIERMGGVTGWDNPPSWYAPSSYDDDEIPF